MKICEICEKEYPAMQIFRWDSVVGHPQGEAVFPEHQDKRICKDCFRRLMDEAANKREEVRKNEALENEICN